MFLRFIATRVALAWCTAFTAKDVTMVRRIAITAKTVRSSIKVKALSIFPEPFRRYRSIHYKPWPWENTTLLWALHKEFCFEENCEVSLSPFNDMGIELKGKMKKTGETAG